MSIKRSAAALTKGVWLKLAVGFASLAVVAGLYGVDRILDRSPSALARAPDESDTRPSQPLQTSAEDAELRKDGGDAARASTANVLPVRVSAVRYLDGYETDERYVGRVIVRRSSDLGFERLGRVATILVDEGTSVEAGQPLASLQADLLSAEKEILRSQLAYSRAERREAEARLKLARATQQRREELARANNMSRQLHDEAVADESAAEARLAAASARIAEVLSGIKKTDLEISQSTLRAPFDGDVVGRFVDEGTTVDAGTPVLRLVESGHLEVRAGIPPHVAETFEIGKRYRIEIAGEVLEAPLAAILPELDAKTRTVSVLFRLENSDNVQAGQIARIVVRRRVALRGFWLPITGLVEGRRGLWNAYGVEDSRAGDGLLRLTSRELTLIYSNAKEAFVTGTVVDGEHLVTTGLHRLVPGQLVRIQ